VPVVSPFEVWARRINEENRTATTARTAVALIDRIELLLSRRGADATVARIGAPVVILCFTGKVKLL